MSDFDIDLFGNKIIRDVLLREKFIEPPFSILDTKSGSWQNRKRKWKELGIKSETGRDAKTFNMKDWANDNLTDKSLPIDTSIFDPALCEVIYKWFCPDGGEILDPFAGGSVRGIVAHYLGYKYTGIELREEQVTSNREQADIIIKGIKPTWIIGDSYEMLDGFFEQVDLVFSCPPYFDLEVYSDLPTDLSNMSWMSFKSRYKEIIYKSCSKLKSGGYAVFVVGEVRDKNGNFINLVGETIKAFTDAGMNYYNEIILVAPVASASLRAMNNMKTEKVVKIHQNVLCFKKG